MLFTHREALICKCLPMALNCTLNDETKMVNLTKYKLLGSIWFQFSVKYEIRVSLCFFISKCIGIQGKRAVKNICTKVRIFANKSHLADLLKDSPSLNTVA